MISRRATVAIADAYHERFTHTSRSYGRYGERSEFNLHRDSLYDFLYAENCDAWLLNAVRAIAAHDHRGLKEFVMQLHTGESLVTATQSWTWEKRRALGQRILKELAESLIRKRIEDPHFETYGDSDKAAVDRMQRALELDGYIYRQSILWVPEETVIEEIAEQDLLEGLFGAVALPDPTTLKHHLQLSASHYQESRWDDSIANSRKVLEGVLQQVAGQHSRSIAQQPLTPDALSKPVVVRDYLQTAGLLEKKEKEAVGQIYGLLSNTGGHPYIAQQDQARLMRHLALTFSQFVLLRLEGMQRAKQADPS